MSERGENETGSGTELGSGEIGVLRIIDAEANRAAEGLRVVEDYVRFVLSDEHLTRLAKELRHELAGVLSEFAPSQRFAARQSQADVGAVLAVEAALPRKQPADVAMASMKRVQQALRGLEEFAKLGHPSVAAALQGLRFRSYTLQRAIGITGESIERLAAARLYVLLDGRADETTFAALAESLVEAGVDMLQLRDKTLDDRQLLSRACRLRMITRGSKTQFIMNDRPDLAALSQADGVHVGQDELTVHDARQIVGPKSLIGVSTHSIEQARQAVIDGANYVGVGPTFPSGTKSFASFTGIELLRAVASEISLPAFAIGGITIENLPNVLETGIRRVAVTGAVVNAAEPNKAAAQLLKTLG